ncbi:GTPase IMAP family member 6-like isoform X2 [Alosa sapidissima]|uniref:GTPase IMAP family member 6-like isoform X2 n=1 Tax=Alosa sapidissima TaxID=34773 RepID=UPI001C07FFB7|nr:GTPase IMAP family member 6-like isoform X2 [Alosa sapidissima]
MVDTPGWWKGYPLIDTAERIKHKLVLSVQHCPPGPHAFILTVETGTFTETNRRSIEEHLGLFGENIWGHTIVVFTKGDSLKDKSIEQHIESQGEALKWVIEKCGNRYHVFDNVNGGDRSQVHQLLEKIEEMDASVSSCDGTPKTPETEVTESHRREKEVRKEMVEFLDKEWTRRDNKLEEKVRAMWRETRRGDRSMDYIPDFQENEVYLDTRGLPIKFPLLSEKPGQAEHEPPEQTERNMQEMFRRELARREVVIMEKFQGIISELRLGVDLSEPGDHEKQEATEKVLNWRTETSDPGVGSELGEEDSLAE